MKGKFTSVILAVVLVVITVGTVFFGYSKASGKAAKSSVEGEQRYAWPLATCSTEDTITHIFATQFAKEVEKLSDGKMKINVYPQVVTENSWRAVKTETSHSLYSLRHHR